MGRVKLLKNDYVKIIRYIFDVYIKKSHFFKKTGAEGFEPPRRIMHHPGNNRARLPIPPHPNSGADDWIRTSDHHVGNVELYH